MIQLENYGFKKIGFWSLSNHKSTKHLSSLQGINFNLNEPVGKLSNSVYVFVSNDKIIYIGETTAGLNSRFQGYRYGNPLKTDTDNRIKIAITKILENKEKVAIWHTTPFGTMELPSGEKLQLPASKPLEEFLISKFSPELNVKNLHK